MREHLTASLERLKTDYADIYYLHRINPDIPVEDVLRFEGELIEFVSTKYPEILESIRETKQMDEETEKKLIQAIEECKKSFK